MRERSKPPNEGGRPEPTERTEQYRREAFARCGLYDVGAMSAALRRLTSRNRRETTDRQT